MLASELRIGNYVNYAAEKVIVLQTSIKSRNKWDVELGYFEDSIGFERMITEIQPIPLTEEWLLRFGFEKEEEQDELLNTFMFCKLNTVRVEFSDKHKQLYWHDNYTSIYHKEIKYVHQLQNLYFALTGKELEY